VAFAVLTGMRREELLGMTWADVDLEGDGAIEVHAGIAKGGRARVVHLDVSPAALRLLKARKLQTGGRGRVWPFAADEVSAAIRRLREYGAPDHFDLKALRRTTATYLTNAPGVYAAASVWRSAKQLGHSVDVAEGHYLGLVRNVDPKADSLEAALEITEDVEHVVEAMQRRRAKRRSA
jgi:integrase